MIGNQSMYQKFFSAKSEKDASVAVVGWVFGTVVLETLIVTLAVVGSGLFALSLVPAPDFAPREIIPFTARHFLTPAVGALLMGSVFAKVISTANNYLFSPATNLINDVYTRFIRPDASQKNVLLVSRFLVAGLGLWALMQAITLTSVLAKAMYAYTIYSAAITPVVMAAFFWRRATREGAVACLLSGTVITVAWDTVKIHPAEGDRGARRNFPGADCQRNCARRGQPGDSTPEPKTDRDVLRIAHKTQAVQIGSVCNLLCKPHVDGGHH